NILEMARIDAGAMAVESRWVHPSELIEAALDQLEHRLRRHRIDVSIESDVLVNLDPRLTASALAQLLQNAAQYTPPDSPIAVTVALAPRSPDAAGVGELIVTVRDRGPGIAPDDLPHLFDRFYRGREAGKRTSGTGMGLSIARGMLVAERGRIWAEDCPDGGARFTIAVPVESKAAVPEEQPA